MLMCPFCGFSLQGLSIDSLRTHFRQAGHPMLDESQLFALYQLNQMLLAKQSLPSQSMPLPFG
jgi:hypothetical protein